MFFFTFAIAILLVSLSGILISMQSLLPLVSISEVLRLRLVISVISSTTGGPEVRSSEIPELQLFQSKFISFFMKTCRHSQTADSQQSMKQNSLLKPRQTDQRNVLLKPTSQKCSSWGYKEKISVSLILVWSDLHGKSIHFCYYDTTGGMVRS